MSTRPQKPDRAARYREFEEWGRRAIEDPASAEPTLPADYWFLMRLWRNSAFGLRRVWTLFESLREPEAPLLVRRVTWDSVKEKQRFTTPMTVVEEYKFMKAVTTPLLTVDDGLVPREHWAAIQSRPPSVRLPPIRPRQGGMLFDGESCGLQHHDSRNLVTFQLEWAEESPLEDFREVADWYLQMRELFDHCIQGAGKA